MVPLKLEAASGFSFSHNELRRLATPRTKLIIICSPGNPTGGATTPSTAIHPFGCLLSLAVDWVLTGVLFSLHNFIQHRKCGRWMESETTQPHSEITTQ